MTDSLTPLQRRVIDALRGLGWTLTGGGALAGYHLGHRRTRDLDFFWHGRSSLEHLPREVEEHLAAAGLAYRREVDARSFCRIAVTDGHATVPIDLVAEPVPWVEPPVEVAPGILVDAPQEILTNKL